MREFKKKTIALILASVVTVAGSFAADNYKNSLMNITFNASGSDVEMTVHTRGAYSGNVSPTRKDANTYVLMLPEIDSKASTPDLSTASGQISSVNIRTMPYTSGGKGYTRVTIKTYSPVNFNSKNAIYVPTASAAPQLETVSEPKEPEIDYPDEELKKEEEKKEQENIDKEKTVKPVKIVVKQAPEVQEVPEEPEATEPETTEDDVETYTTTEKSSDNYLFILGVLFILLCSIFFFTKGKNKLHEITGEILEIDVDSDDEPKKKKKEKPTKNVRSQIKTLDAQYTKPSSMPKPSEYTQPVATQQIQPVEENVVDLDELFQEQAKSKESIDDDENAALEDFLNGFSFDDTEYPVEEVEEGPGYDEEFYDETLANNNLIFSKDDYERIGKLLNTEINDDTLRNIEKYAVSNPIIKKPSKKQILEDLVATYSISQNITFTQDDVSALYKLINVEIDADFITDLKTNPERMQEMYKEMEASSEQRRKPSEILTLSVKDDLPDLSAALKKQGNRKIESEVKPTTVYFSEGYEVSTLKIDEALPDLAASIGNADAYKFKPTEKIQYVDSSYEVETFKKIDDLPDLQDVLAHPEKYATPEPEEVVVDEEALLNNIANVQFKPFYDGSVEYEQINNPEDLPSVSDIQKEFSQFDNFEITEEEEIQTTANEEYDDFAALYSNEYVDLDQVQKETSENLEGEFIPEDLTQRKISKTQPRERSKNSSELLDKINASKTEREKKTVTPAERDKKVEKIVEQENKTDLKCIIDGESFTVVSSTEFATGFGCHLAKNENGYAILGYIGDKLCKLKSYETLKSEKIHSRLSDNVDENTSRYLIRIGINKFVVDVSDNNINYVMDL